MTTLHKGNGQCSMVNEQNRSYFELLIHKSNLQSCLCQYVKDLCDSTSCLTSIVTRGEYRGRTDDLLHAMQAL